MIMPYHDKSLPEPEAFCHGLFGAASSLIVGAEIERDKNDRFKQSYFSFFDRRLK